MAGNRDEAIARHAYSLWEAEGRPKGQHERHWAEAEHHIGMMGDGTAEQSLNQTGNPKARITKAEVEAAFGQRSSPEEEEVGTKDRVR